MKVPDFLFAVINPVMSFLLRSPLHALAGSSSLMLITFTGRRSGRRFTTPVRYLRVDGAIRCFTARENQWWRNLRGGADVVLRLAGQELPHHAVPRTEDRDLIRDSLVHYLALFPGDAAYQGIRLNRDKTLVAADLERALDTAIVVECHPLA